MPQYLLTNYLPDNFDPSTVNEATINAINALNEELIAAGARLLAAGLAPASQANPTAATAIVFIVAGC